MSKIQNIIRNFLLAGTPSIWDAAFRHSYLAALGQAARHRIDIESGALLANWAGLDTLDLHLIAGADTPELREKAREKLTAHRHEINDEVERFDLGRLSVAQLRRELDVILPALLEHPSTGLQFASPWPDGWPQVAKLIAAELHTLGSDRRRDLPEWQLLNRLLLAAYFNTCALPHAGLVRDALKELPGRVCGVRGTFVRIVEQVSPDGVQDAVPPVAGNVPTGPLRHVGLSVLQALTSDEMARIPIEDGFMARNMKPHAPVAPQLQAAAAIVSVADLAELRKMQYRQCEYTVLAYLSLACIEQLLRAAAANMGVEHLRNGVPRPVLNWIDNLGCSPAMRTAIDEVYGVNRGNVRNRMMHGGLLDVESTRMELILRRGTRVLGPYFPENIAAICTSSLVVVDDELTGKVLSAVDLAWSAQFWPTPDEMLFAHGLPNDFTGASGLANFQQMGAYLTVMLPSVSQFFKVGMQGWLGQPNADTFVYFATMALIFEAMFRSTVHLVGLDVLQTDWTNCSFKYRMLDERGLAGQEVLDALTCDVPGPDRIRAEKCLKLAIKGRNLLAHGSIGQIAPDEFKALGSVIVKAAITLMGVGYRHMTERRAYYISRARGELTREGDAVADWYQAEREIAVFLGRSADQARRL